MPLNILKIRDIINYSLDSFYKGEKNDNFVMKLDYMIQPIDSY